MDKFGVVCVVFSVLFGVCMSSGLPPEAFNTLWTYNETFAAQYGLLGPSGWKQSWPYCYTEGSDTVESPININTKEVVVDSAGVLPLSFNMSHADASCRNIGATLSIAPNSPYSFFVTASGTKYALNEVHIHWDRYGLHNGSEHTINNKGEFAEVHLVHYNAKFPTFDDAVHDGQVGNVAVVAILYNVYDDASKKSDTDSFAVFNGNHLKYPDLNKPYDLIDGNMYELFGSKSLDDLPMFHYNGSLTTPTCNPIVSWYVAQERVMISQEQLKNLRLALHVNQTAEQEGIVVDNNARPVCPVNGRRIVAWPKIVDEAATTPSASIVVVLIAVLAVLLSVLML